MTLLTVVLFIAAFCVVVIVGVVLALGIYVAAMGVGLFVHRVRLDRKGKTEAERLKQLKADYQRRPDDDRR